MLKPLMKNYGLVAIIVMCGLGAMFTYHNNHKSEPLKPTTITAPKVEAEAEGKSITPASASPLDTVDPFKHKPTEEEVIASITRNACLRRCPLGTSPVFAHDEVIGFYSFESGLMTHFDLGDRLIL